MLFFLEANLVWNASGSIQEKEDNITLTYYKSGLFMLSFLGYLKRTKSNAFKSHKTLFRLLDYNKAFDVLKIFILL